MSAKQGAGRGGPPEKQRGGSADADTLEPDDGGKSERERLDDKLDHALEESFPGSDPVNLTQPPHSPQDERKRRSH